MADIPYKIFGVHPSRLRAALTTSAFTDVLPYVNAFTMDFNLTTLNFEYDGTQDQVQVGQALTGTIGLGKFNTALLDSVVGATAVTTSLPSGFSSLWNPELGTYPFVQAEIHLRVQDDSATGNGAETELAIFIWKMKLQNPFAVGNIGNLEANTQTLNWTATATTLDALGAAIPGVTAPQTVTYSILKKTAA